MMNKAKPPDLASRGDIRAGRQSFIVTVVAVYVAMFVFSQHAFTLYEVVGLVAVGGVYLLVGWYAGEIYARAGSPFVLSLFYAIEIPLSGLIVYWMADFFLAGLIVLPLAGLSVLALPRRWMVIVCALLVVALGASYGLRGGWEAALLAGIGYLTAIVFVVSITRVAMGERQARAEVERLATELGEANRKLHEYIVRVEELAVAQERSRLAHEIHDTVGHVLAALNVQIELLARLPYDEAEARERAAEQARALQKQGQTDLWRAVQALRPVALKDISLPEAIAGLVDDFGDGATWQVEGERRPLPPDCVLALYRAAQEALTNVERHAPTAGLVTVHLHYAPEAVTLTVENTSPALPASPPQVGGGEGGHGLRGLRERAGALGGTFSAGPDGAGGFRVEMSLPLG